jgi:hypothetical protein
MNQNSCITPGIVTFCKHKRELYKELRNDNPTVASYYRDCCKILTGVIKMGNKIEHDKLIQNSHDKIKITWGIVNKNREEIKKHQIQALNVEDRKITNQQTIAETFNDFLLLLQKMLKHKAKIISLMIIELIIKVVLWNKRLINPTQQWNIGAQQ